MGDSVFAEVRDSGSLPFHGISYLRSSEPYAGRTERRELGEGMHALDILCLGRTEPPLCMAHLRAHHMSSPRKQGHYRRASGCSKEEGPMGAG